MPRVGATRIIGGCLPSPLLRLRAVMRPTVVRPTVVRPLVARASGVVERSRWVRAFFCRASPASFASE